jgi:hypothetical protein
MLTRKIALYLGTSPLPLPPAPPQVGIWAVLHEVRSEYAQTMCALFLLIAGPGPCSIDAVLTRARTLTSPGDQAIGHDGAQYHLEARQPPASPQSKSDR